MYEEAYIGTMFDFIKCMQILGSTWIYWLDRPTWVARVWRGFKIECCACICTKSRTKTIPYHFQFKTLPILSILCNCFKVNQLDPFGSIFDSMSHRVIPQPKLLLFALAHGKQSLQSFLSKGSISVGFWFEANLFYSF